MVGKSKTSFCSALISFSTLYALIIKNFIKILRNPTTLMLILLLPILEVLIFCVAIGKDPNNLKVAIINEEMPNMLDSCSFEKSCKKENISCWIFQHLSDNKIFKFKEYTSVAIASNELLEGHLYGYIHFKKNFSDAFFQRMITLLNPQKEILMDSTINVRFWLLTLNFKALLCVIHNIQEESSVRFTLSFHAHREQI